MQRIIEQPSGEICKGKAGVQRYASVVVGHGRVNVPHLLLCAAAPHVGGGVVPYVNGLAEVGDCIVEASLFCFRETPTYVGGGQIRPDSGVVVGGLLVPFDGFCEVLLYAVGSSVIAGPKIKLGVPVTFFCLLRLVIRSMFWPEVSARRPSSKYFTSSATRLRATSVDA